MNGIQFSGTVLITWYRIGALAGGVGGGDPPIAAASCACKNASFSRDASMPRFGSPVASGMVASIPHTMFATSSRNNITSSVGALLKIEATVGGRTRLVSAAAPALFTTSTVNMLHRCQFASAPLPAAAIQKRSLNVLVTTRPLVVAIAPEGSVYGTINQSFA